MSFYAFCFYRVPTIAKRVIDLHRLFVEVTSRGGVEKVWLLFFFSRVIRFCVQYVKSETKPSVIKMLIIHNPHIQGFN